MCDTLIATKLATSNGIAVFGKNSDRPPNEGQHLAYFPAATHPANSRLKCTYIEIPQALKTNAVLLSKPFWMWGAEIGVNEHGLVIGNEAIFSKVPANKKPALLGMDLLRAALERALTPREGVQGGRAWKASPGVRTDEPNKFRPCSRSLCSGVHLMLFWPLQPLDPASQS